MESSKYKQRLLQEIRENMRRYGANVRELKWVLYYLGDDPAALLSDWDWQWPKWIRLLPIATRAADKARGTDDLPSGLLANINRLYALFCDQPLDIADIADLLQPSDNELYLRIFERLDARYNEIAALVRQVELMVAD